MKTAHGNLENMAKMFWCSHKVVFQMYLLSLLLLIIITYLFLTNAIPFILNTCKSQVYLVILWKNVNGNTASENWYYIPPNNNLNAKSYILDALFPHLHSSQWWMKLMHRLMYCLENTQKIEFTPFFQVTLKRERKKKWQIRLQQTGRI